MKIKKRQSLLSLLLSLVFLSTLFRSLSLSFSLRSFVAPSTKFFSEKKKKKRERLGAFFCEDACSKRERERERARDSCFFRFFFFDFLRALATIREKSVTTREFRYDVACEETLSESERFLFFVFLFFWTRRRSFP